MAKLSIILDNREAHKTKEGKFRLYLRVSHKGLVRLIYLHKLLFPNQFDPKTYEVTGFIGAATYSKRLRKRFADVDLWLDEHRGHVYYWNVTELRDHIQHEFFNISPPTYFYNHAAEYLYQLWQEKRYGTFNIRENGIKALLKYQLFLKGKATEKISDVFFKTKKEFKLLEEYQAYNIDIRRMDYHFFRKFKSYLENRASKPGTIGNYLSTMKVLLNEASRKYPALKDHKPLENIKITIGRNEPNPLTPQELEQLKNTVIPIGNPLWHIKNYLLFMFYNMGMNFHDLTKLKVHQFKDGRIHYVRTKTKGKKRESFHILQTSQALDIINFYIKGKQSDDYLFPILKKTASEAIIYNESSKALLRLLYGAKKLAQLAGINKKITSYTMRDTWTNIGLDLGVDLRSISSGLGHSDVQTTQKHYAQRVRKETLDKIPSTKRPQTSRKY